MPTIDGVLEELGVANVFSKMDLVAGYFQIQLASPARVFFVRQVVFCGHVVGHNTLAMEHNHWRAADVHRFH